MVKGRSTLGLVAWVCLLVLVLVVFGALGGGGLAGPPLAEPASWMAWAGQRGPGLVLFAVLRLVVLGLAWYLLAVSLIGIAARVVRVRRLVAAADLVTVPLVRRMLQGTLGVSLVTTSLGAVGTPAGASEQPPNIVEIRDGASEADDDWWRITEQDILGEPAATTTATPTPSVEPWVTRDAQPEAEAQEAPVEQEPAPGRWEVRAGEHFWSMAERVVGDALGREPTDEEVEPYWRVLVQENRSGLADPENPDLIYPGQVFTLPAAPGAGGG